MTDRLRIACVQMRSSDVKADNLETAAALVARAAASGADVVLLPEKWNAVGPADVFRANAEALEDGETVRALRAWAAHHAVTIVGGSITEAREGHERLSNTCVVAGPDGEIAAVYRKIHMFDVEVGGHVYHESEAEEPGDELVACDVDGWQLGLTICYDIRFPELYRILAVEGSELFTVPAAFTLFTGKDHWELLLRARAVENGCFVAAANSWGTHSGNRATYGRSMIVDPWGVVLATAPDEDAVVTAEIDKAQIARVRRAVPSLANRQPAVYRWPTPV